MGEAQILERQMTKFSDRLVDADFAGFDLF
jgi:hypothetical protein